jgi:hypothetical protein
MEAIRIWLFCILAAICYGEVHDQITAHLCVEYFSIGHPPVFHTTSPFWLAVGWGVIATWWMGAILGFPMMLAARFGRSRRALALSEVRPLVGRLLLVMGACALLSGVVGYCVASSWTPLMYRDIGLGYVPEACRVRFMADAFAHLASYGVGFFGGIVACVLAWRRRAS